MARSDVQLRELRSTLNGLIVRAMKRDDIREITRWADHHGIGKTTLYSLLSGRRTSGQTWVKPSVDTLVKLARALDVPLHELLYVIVPEAPGADDRRHFSSDHASAFGVQRIPVTDTKPKGRPGRPQQFVYVESSFGNGKDLRAFLIHGESMGAGSTPIHDGDIVIVDALDKGNDSSSVVARLKGDRYVCRVLKDDRFGRLLQSRNVDHTDDSPSAISMDQVTELVGCVVRVIHNNN